MADHPIIKLGSRGKAVELAQQRLLERFYLFNQSDVDGVFGYVTLNAVITYQRDRNDVQGWFALSFPLVVDGIVGPQTWFRLDPDTVKKGSKGRTVRFLQEVLKNMGPDFDPGPVDGDFGSLTEDAVKFFQSTFNDFNGNPLVQDGIAGPKTWSALWS